MDFLESFVVKNDRIPEDMKIDLFEKDNMLVYDFVGELLSLEGKSFFTLKLRNSATGLNTTPQGTPKEAHT